MSWLVGVDVGGTFTDFFAYDARTRVSRLFKIPSTPENPAAAIGDGLREMCQSFAIDGRKLSRLCHGTTVATNALIQRKGAKVAVITTRGFRDLLEIGRQTRPHLYSLQIDHPEPLVPRQRRFEVEERITDGPKILRPIDRASMQRAITAVKESGAESCAVCLLFSFLDDSHERKVGEALARDARSTHLAKVLEEDGSVEAADVAVAASHGEAAAIELITNAGRLIGSTLAGIVNFFNPSLVVIGGGVAGSGDLLLATIRESVYRRSLPLATRELVVKRSALGDRAGVVGAAAIVTDELFSPSHLTQWLGVGTPNGGHVVAAPTNA